MQIEHIAMYVKDLEKTRDFFVKQFNVVSSEVYHNKTTGLCSYFLSFDTGTRVEIMEKPKMEDYESIY